MKPDTTEIDVKFGYEYPRMLFCFLTHGQDQISLSECQIRKLHKLFGDALNKKESDLADHIRRKNAA